jgi:glycosyltransferase involved in cell wall biosynthesis
MKFSILVPVYNVEPYISRCLDSILNQTYSEFEVIVVDDCGTDNSMLIVSEYQKRDSRINVIKHACNLGLNRVRETGINNSNGDYVVFCDGDDFMPINVLQEYSDIISKESPDLITSPFEYRQANGKKICDFNQLNGVMDYWEIYDLLLSGKMTHNLWGRAYKRSLLDGKNYIFKDNFNNTEDILLFYQIVPNLKKCVFANNIGYYYMQNKTSITNNRLSDEEILNGVFSWNIRLELVERYVPQLLNKARKLTFDAYITRLGQGYDKKMIDSALSVSFDLEYVLSNCRWRKCVFALLILEFSVFRKLYSKILRIA